MQRNLRSFPFIAALMMLCAAVRLSHAAGAGIADNAHIFKPDTVTAADQIIQQIKSQQKHDVRVETYSAIPDDLKSRYTPEQKGQFFVDWADRIGKENSIKGIVILICMDPSYIQVVVGTQTRQKAFTVEDRNSVRDELLTAFKQKNYDAGILDALRTIQSRMAANIGSTGAAANSTGNSGGAYPGGGYSTAAPNSSSTHGFHFGGLICLAIGVIAIIMLFSAIARRNRGYGYGAPPPQGGYPPGYVGGGGYPPGYTGGGGGGFGRGLLGGLLGGALGAWGYDRMTHGNQGSGGYIPPPTSGGSGDMDTSSPGGDFNSSTPDVGGGGDFGSSDTGGGGGDFGGGGGDSGGGDFGGGGGGDSGGGGGDF